MHGPPVDPASLTAAGRPVGVIGLRPPPPPRDAGHRHAATALVAAGQAAALTRAGPDTEATRGHDDAMIGAGLMASHGAWKPERPERCSSQHQNASQVTPAGIPNHRRPCIGRLAHHIILQPERAGAVHPENLAIQGGLHNLAATGLHAVEVSLGSPPPHEIFPDKRLL